MQKSKLNKTTKSYLLGATVINVGDNYITLTGNLNVYLEDSEIDNINFPELTFSDSKGTELKVGDKVILIDVDDFDPDDYLPQKWSVLEVTKLSDLESNYIGFDNKYAFYGHRVIKVPNL